MAKFIFVTGGVISSLGKGVASASIGALLKARGFKVRMRKMDPYLNVDPGTMSPFQHGEVFVTDDGAETDLDLGHYERFTDTACKRTDSISGGRIYWNVLTKERAGDYLGATVQSIPHITNEVKNFISTDLNGEDFVIYEIGGTVGDMEGSLILEGMRQFINQIGHENAILVHLTYVPFIRTASEVKTKPTQQSVRLLLEAGLFPNVIMCRSDSVIPEAEKRKIAMFCNVRPEDVISAPDVRNVYEIPLVYHNEGLDDRILAHFDVKAKKPDLREWEGVSKVIGHWRHKVVIGVVAKYCGFPDAYKSLVEALYHAGLKNDSEVRIKWINAEDVERADSGEIGSVFAGIDGMIVPGGFGARGIEGKIRAAGYAREHGVPYLGICLGMQIAVIEMARNLLGIKDANSTEFAHHCTPIISLITEWDKDGKMEVRDENSDKGGTLRLGAYTTRLSEGSLASRIYGEAREISERHRHRYEMDIGYEDALAKQGVVISGRSPDGRLPEVIEIPAHKFFIAGQFHPEFKSRPFKPAPLFDALVGACLE
ncbi:MAG: CTP synthase [Rickettsiales bacterium]|jgi:CTP synthase|nr:CTP synthase [Rickettsiales bacterium]